MNKLPLIATDSARSRSVH